MIVRDLAAGARRWERLGFQLTPVSAQTGVNPQTGASEPWATANRCAVLKQGYLELIGIHRHGLPNPWSGLLARSEGAHILALRCDNADAVYPFIAARCDDFALPVQRRRMAPAGDREQEMRFRNIFSRDEYTPECRYIIIEHQTPEVLWQPPLMNHPNGAYALSQVTLCGKNDQALANRWQALGADRNDPAPTSVPLTSGKLIRRTQADMQTEFPGVTIRDCSLAHCPVAVHDLDRTTAWLQSRDIPFHLKETGVWVEPAHANGCILEFEESFAPNEAKEGVS